MGYELFRGGEMGMNDPLGLKIITTGGRDAQENAMFSIFSKKALINQLHLENE